VNPRDGAGPVAVVGDEPREAKRVEEPARSKPNLRKKQRTPAPLSEPLKVAEFWKSRHRSETVRLTIGRYNDHVVVDVRVYLVARDGRMSPSKAGVCLAVTRLPELKAMIDKAVRKAVQLGLLDEGRP